jgi:peptidoglycan-associated lipoprotein
MTRKPQVLVLAMASTALALLAGSVAGCGDEPKPPQTGDDVATTSTATAKKPEQSDSRSAVQIDDKIVKACGDLPTARFSFDSSEVTPEASNALDALARCFVSGPLKGKGMKLVGHADPRGETEYNLALGQRRAGSVAGFLQKKGLEDGRMETSSKGEFEATGTDDEGWAKDRKVEILLKE